MSIRVVAHLQAHPDKANELRELLEGLVVPTRQEVGCVSYELLESLEDPAKFTFVEEWTSEEALRAHLGTEHVQYALASFPDLLAADLDLRTYQVVR